MSNLSDFIGGGGGITINGVAPLAVTDDLHISEDGTTWLRTGVLSTDGASYPDATTGGNYSLFKAGPVVASGSVVISATLGSSPTDFHISSDGTKVYVSRSVGGRDVFQFDVSTPFDFSTLTYSSNEYDPSAQITTLSGVTFSDDGTKMYLCDQFDSTIEQYTLSTAFDLSTASYASKSFDTSANVAEPQRLTITPAGDAVYVFNDADNDVYRYTLGTAFDISTAVFDSIVFLNKGDQILFNNDGSKIFVASNSSVLEYEIDPHYVGTIAGTGLSMPTQNVIDGLCFNADGSRLISVSGFPYEEYALTGVVGIAVTSTDTDTGLPIYLRIA